jgi:hypothetical protein
MGNGSVQGPEDCGNIITTECSDSPFAVPGLSGVGSLGTSNGNSPCVIIDTTPHCWGSNNSSQLGIGEVGPETCANGFKCNPTPSPVSGLTDVAGVAGGDSHTCAVLINGAVFCWGNKFFGATGDDTWSPTSATAHTPVGVIGLSGDDTTPTPSPQPPGQQVWGDLNCSGASDPVDALTGLRFDAGLTVTQGPDCPGLDDPITVNDLQVTFADVDCSGDFTPVDPLKILRSDAGLSVDSEPDCPEIGEEVQI